MSGTSTAQVRRNATGMAVAFLILLLLLGGGAAAGYAVMQANGSLEAQSQRLFSQEARQVKEEIDKVFSPALDLLQQSVLNAESGFVPVDDKEKFNRWLATQLKLTPGLAWFSYGDERTGRYYAARRETKDQSIVIHNSDPKDNGGRAVEFRLDAGDVLTRLDTSHLPGEFDPRKREWYHV